MKIDSRKLTLISLVANIVFALGIVYFIAKRWYFEHQVQNSTSVYFWDNPQYAEQVNLESAYAMTGKIVMLGNSLIYKEHWNELLQRNDVINRGIGSDITEGYLPRLRYVLNAHARICFIEGGLNDLATHIPPDSTIAHLSVLVDTLLHYNIIPVLHTVIYVSKGSDGQWMNAAITALNKKILTLARQKGAECIDLNPTLSENGVLKPAYSQSDGIHLTALGYLQWKAAIEQMLRKHAV